MYVRLGDFGKEYKPCVIMAINVFFLLRFVSLAATAGSFLCFKINDSNVVMLVYNERVFQGVIFTDHVNSTREGNVL